MSDAPSAASLTKREKNRKCRLLMAAGAGIVLAGGVLTGLYSGGIIWQSPQAKCEKGLQLMGAGETGLAIELFMEAADSSYAPAHFELAKCRMAGIGVEKDAAEAVHHYRMAAELGHAGAQGALAGCYESGCGVAVDSAEAARWYLAAAEQGVAEAQYKHALHCAASQNMEEAVRWRNHCA